MIGKGLWKRTHKLNMTGAELDAALAGGGGGGETYLHTIHINSGPSSSSASLSPVGHTIQFISDRAEAYTISELVAELRENGYTIANGLLISPSTNVTRVSATTIGVANIDAISAPTSGDYINVIGIAHLFTFSISDSDINIALFSTSNGSITSLPTLGQNYQIRAL